MTTACPYPDGVEEPQSIALRTLPPLLYGSAHPYGVSFTGTGETESVKKLTREDLVAFHRNGSGRKRRHCSSSAISR